MQYFLRWLWFSAQGLLLGYLHVHPFGRSLLLFMACLVPLPVSIFAMSITGDTGTTPQVHLSDYLPESSPLDFFPVCGCPALPWHAIALGVLSAADGSG